MKAEMIWQMAESLRANLDDSHRDGLETLYFLKFYNEKVERDELQNFSRLTMKERIQYSLQGSEMN